MAREAALEAASLSLRAARILALASALASASDGVEGVGVGKGWVWLGNLGGSRGPTWGGLGVDEGKGSR